jgi:thiol-disulfide isomerase/thioredoxin
MKKLITAFFLLMLFTTPSFSQIGATAPDFTVTDINGKIHRLYSLLDSGKIVILDCSATWCPPCWGFHSAHYLEDLYKLYGPKGNNTVRILFYEADPKTTLANLQGQGTSSETKGNWLAGTSYPFINETTISLNGKIYWPNGYPTVNVICPSTKKIVADLFNSESGGLAAMKTIIQTSCGTVSASNTVSAEKSISIYPSPTTDNATLCVNSNAGDKVEMNVYSSLGQLLSANSYTSLTNGSNLCNLNMSNYPSGVYFVHVSHGSMRYKVQSVIKK